MVSEQARVLHEEEILVFMEVQLLANRFEILNIILVA